MFCHTVQVAEDAAFARRRNFFQEGQSGRMQPIVNFSAGPRTAFSVFCRACSFACGRPLIDPLAFCQTPRVSTKRLHESSRGFFRPLRPPDTSPPSRGSTARARPPREENGSIVLIGAGHSLIPRHSVPRAFSHHHAQKTDTHPCTRPRSNLPFRRAKNDSSKAVMSDGEQRGGCMHGLDEEHASGASADLA